jgi:PAS domain S-box-containing protein
LAAASAGLVTTVGAVVLLGWVLDVPALRSFFPGTNPMVASTAVCFMLSGAALWLRRSPVSRPRTWLARGLALATAVIGLMKLAEYAFGWNLGLDQTLNAIDPGPFPGVMAVPTAITFVLVGMALATLDVETAKGRRPAQIAAVIAIVPPAFGLIGRLYGVPTLSSYAAGTVVMAIHTALAFLVLTAGILAARPGRGLVPSFTSDGPAGLMLRRLLPGAVAALLLAGWLRVEGQNAGLYGTEFGSALLVSLSIVLLSVLIWRSAASLERADRLRREAAERFSRMFEVNPVPTVITRVADGKILYANPAFLRSMGWTHTEVLGRTVLDLGLWADPAEREPVVRSLQASGRATDLEVKLRRKDGRTVEVLASVEVLELDGESCLIALFNDITARKETERALEEARLEAERAAEASSRLAAIVQGSEDAILSKDTEGVITSWNQSAERLYGYQADEIIGRSVSTLIPSHRSGEERKILDRILAGEVVSHYETERVRKDGTVVQVSLTVSPLRDLSGLITGASTIARDISEENRVREALGRAREEADRARKEAVLASQAKSEFLSRMSHELRTPLNAVLGFGQLLEMEDLDTESRESVAQIVKAGHHLLDLINEVLDISRIETGKLSLSLEPVALEDVAAETVEMVRPMAGERKIRLEVDKGPMRARYVLADRQRLKQVLLNLLSNAIKYNRATGDVNLSFGQDGDGRIRVAVRDTGPGITPEDQARLFEPFQRLEADQTGVQGTGLGLALSRGLVEAMGGTMGVESAVGSGTTFWLELSEAHRPVIADEEIEATPAASSNGPRTVLYVEDNSANLRLVERAVARRPGISLLTAQQGRIGIDLARQHRPDLILLDLHLPDLSGEEVLRSLQEDPVTRRVPVVMVSADATPARVKQLLAAGARTYLTKPLDMRRFFRLLDEI